MTPTHPHKISTADHRPRNPHQPTGLVPWDAHRQGRVGGRPTRAPLWGGARGREKPVLAVYDGGPGGGDRYVRAYVYIYKFNV